MQAGIENFLCAEAMSFERRSSMVPRPCRDDVSRFGLLSRGWPIGADIDEIFLPGSTFEFRIRSAADHAVANEARPARACPKTNAGVLIGKAGGSSQIYRRRLPPSLGRRASRAQS
jgi:hypothetical protein